MYCSAQSRATNFIACYGLVLVLGAHAVVPALGLQAVGFVLVKLAQFDNLIAFVIVDAFDHKSLVGP